MNSPEVKKILAELEASGGFFTEGNYRDINQCNALGENALHFMAVWNKPDYAKVLASNGIDIDKRGEHGYTPLHEAIEQGHTEMVDCLLSLGADVEIKNDDGLNCMELAELWGNQAIVQLVRGA